MNYFKFGLIGGTGVLVDTAVLFILTSPSAAGFHLLLSKAFAAEAAIINNFVWNELWTFKSRGLTPLGPRLQSFCAFNLVCLAGIGWSLLLLKIQTSVLHFNMWLANLVAITLVSLWNYYWITKWNEHRLRPTARPLPEGFNKCFTATAPPCSQMQTLMLDVPAKR